MIQNEAALKASYDALYSRGTIRDSDRYYEWILRLLGPKAGRSLCDVSCGGGFLLAAAEARGLKTFGVDISSQAIALARKNAPNSDVRESSAENLPWQDRYFDYITCLGSLEHYLNPEQGLKEIARVLKDDGLACFALPNSYFISDIFRAWLWGAGPSHGQDLERFATRNEWQALLEENGLRVDGIFRYNGFTELFVRGTLKLKSLKKFIRQKALDWFCPFNLSYSFVYICSKENDKINLMSLRAS